MEKDRIISFEVLFKEYADALFAYGLKFCRDTNIVEDAIQDLFLKLIRNNTDFSSVENVKAYLFCSYRRKLLELLSERKLYSIDGQESLRFMVELRYVTFLNESSLDDETIRRRQDLLKMIEQLTSRQKEVVYLYYIQDLPLDQIADIMGMNYQSVRNLVHRAIGRLRELVKKSKFSGFSILLATLLIHV